MRLYKFSSNSRNTCRGKELSRESCPTQSGGKISRAILVSPRRRERKNTRFLLQTVRREARNTVSWPKPFGGKLETLFPDPNYSAARYRGAILAPRGAAGRKITRFLSHAEPREGIVARFLSHAEPREGKSRDSCPMRSRGKELSHDSCPTRNCGKELSHDSCLSRTAASWRQRTILPHGDSWHAFRGKMTGRASTKSRNA